MEKVYFIGSAKNHAPKYNGTQCIESPQDQYGPFSLFMGKVALSVRITVAVPVLFIIMIYKNCI